MSIKKTLIKAFQGVAFCLKQAYKKNPAVPKDSVRARIYENLEIHFNRISHGVYMTMDEECIVMEGDGRDLSFLSDNSMDCIITYHPWDDKAATKGGSLWEACLNRRYLVGTILLPRCSV